MLVQGGDCFSHWHSVDRVPTHDTLTGLQELEVVRQISGNYTVKPEDDFLLVTAASPLNVQLYPMRGGRHLTVIRVSGSSAITILPAVGETVNGGASVVLNASYTAMKFKAFQGIGWIGV